MSRFDVTIKLWQSHSFAIEAENPDQAQTAALAQLGSRPAEEQHVEIVVTRGMT